MQGFVRILLLAWCVVVVFAEEDKPQYTRTALHVARSLDPESTETMTVRTRTGDVATLIVKRRNGKQRSGLEAPSENFKSKAEASRDLRVPNPVYITSAPFIAKEEKEDASRNSKATLRDRVYMTSTLLRPRHEEDTKQDLSLSNTAPEPVYISTFPSQNINLEKFRDEQLSKKLPDPVYIRSDSMLVKGQKDDVFNKRSRNLMKIDSDGIPVVTGIRMPDDESDKHVWRNARVINNVLVTSQKTTSKQSYDSQGIVNDKKKVFGQAGLTKLEPIKQAFHKQKVNNDDEWKHVETPQVVPVMDAPSVQEWHSVQYPEEYVKVIEEPERITEEDRIVRDRILDYIKSVNRQESSGRHFNRNTRMLQEPKMEARVLHVPGNTVYPTSLLYSPPSSLQPSRVSFEEGVRTPVLQYAHPELGVQPANVAAVEVDVEDDNKFSGRREQALAYFAHDIHADRSPYAFEPGLEDEARIDVDGNKKRSNSGSLPQRPKKTLSYFYPDQAVTDSYNNKYNGKYGYGDSYKGKYQVTVVRPFWEQLSDTIRGHVQTGMERVQEMARPVVDPLVEASQKISQNLGLGAGNREFSTIKEKLGVAGTPSVFLPALGLVAGGAALGLGAVAVGRYLDVDMLMRSQGSDVTLDDVSAEHKRALASINQETSLREMKNDSRRRRSADMPEEVMERMIQSLDGSHENIEGIVTPPGIWGSTPCAKKVFCQVMSAQSDEAVMLMEKKMATYLNMLHPSMTGSIAHHLDDVMLAVKRRDCSAFLCTASRITNLPMPR